MGYTHYWHRKAEGQEPLHLMARALADMAEVIRRSPVPLVGPEGRPDTEPEVSERGVLFNGLGDLSHEPCVVLVTVESRPWEMGSDPWSFRFCKTERKPYDAVVVACLLAAKHRLGEHIRIESDGEWDPDWLQGAKRGLPSGVALYESVFPERAPVGCPFEQERRK